MVKVPRAVEEDFLVPTVGSKKPAREAGEGSKPAGALAYVAVLLVVYGLVIALSLHRLWATPEPLGVDASANQFSEGRALQHVKALTDIGIRLVGHPEAEQAAQYLVRQGEVLMRQAKQTRPDLLVKVARESVSGAVETSFLNHEYVNLYNNVTNVILVVSPRSGLHEKSVLVNAHFDSTLGSVGASDDASCVGVILEMARTIIANSRIQLAAPIVFLMNGAEEALCPASHGFMQQSAWAKDLGVFLNLESTGPGGPDFLFQHTGRWPIQVVATVAPFPRGSVTAQDFFELGLVPADTDYRMFSASMQGTLPGLDTAFLLDAGIYHTDRDTIENIRAGTVQAMGQNALAIAQGLGKELALRRFKHIDDLDTEKSVFFDVLGIFMVVYPFSWAKLIHRAPLFITLSLPYLQTDAFPAQSLTSLYTLVALETLAALASILSAVLSAVFMAILRVTSLGSPMAWYGHNVMPYAMLVPAAVAGLLIPYLGRKIDPRIAALGNMLAFSLLSSVLTSFNLGTSFVGTIWALAGLITMSDLTQKPDKLLQWATINCMWPIVMMLPNAIALSLFVLQKSSLMGAQGQPTFTPMIADGLAGAVIALVVVSVTGFLTPWFAYACGKGLRRTVLFLFCISAFFAIQASLGTPYTRLAPKKIFLQHLHEHSQDGTVTRSVMTVGAVDSVPVDSLLQGRDPNLWAAQRAGWEWQTLYPLNEEYVSSAILQAPRPSEHVMPPTLQLLERVETPGSRERLHLQMHLPGPGYFGSLNVSGPILDWSLPSSPSSLLQRGRPHNRYVRFVGSGPEEHWRFWVDLPQEGTLAVRLAAAHPKKNSAIEEFIADWPEWTFVVGLTTYASLWKF